MSQDAPVQPPRYQPTPEDWAWKLRRLGYYALHLAFFLIVVTTIGPNLILFHNVFSPSLAAYAIYAKPFEPTVAAIKAYNRDFGHLPADTFELPPQYMPPNAQEGEILDTTSITFAGEGHCVLEYEFSPDREGWIVHAPRVSGQLPAPIVAAAPKPTSRPTTR